MIKLKFTFVTLCLVFLISHTVYALNYVDPNLDQDMDGLHDQDEIMTYHTDPQFNDSDGDGFYDGTEVEEGTDPLDKFDPGTFESKINDQATNTPWPWYFARVSGVVSYILLYLLMITGIGITSGFIFTFVGPIIIWRVHRTIGISLFLFILLHIVSLFFDSFVNFSLVDLLVPFVSDYQPLGLNLGILGFYLLVIITLTSIVLIVKKYRM